MNIGRISEIELNPETAYLAGVIVGDGHISNKTKSKSDQSKDYRIAIELNDLTFIKLIEKIIKDIIITKSTTKKRPKIKGNRQQLYYFQFRNKSFHHFLTTTLGIKSGKKSAEVVVPKKIMQSLNLQKSFLAGLFDTDGGIRGNTIGFTSASFSLIEEIHGILENIDIKNSKESWINKKNNQAYFGIKLHSKSIDRFLNELPFQNKEKLNKVFLSRGRAGAVKRDG